MAADPDPDVPDELNDRAADNWRPLLAIADLAGGDWPHRAREAACVLSGAGHEAKSINVECLADIKLAFGKTESMWSLDLVETLNTDPERPWATWNKGKPITQKQLAGLLKPFGIISEVIWVNGKSAKGYKRVRFEEAWAAYLPGQNHCAGPPEVIFPSKRQSADKTGTSDVFSPVRATLPDGSKNSNLPHSHAGFDALTGKSTRPGATDSSKIRLSFANTAASQPHPPRPSSSAASMANSTCCTPNAGPIGSCRCRAPLPERGQAIEQQTQPCARHHRRFKRALSAVL